MSIQLLLSEANPDDGLMADISKEYKLDRPTFVQNAKLWVARFAKDSSLNRKRTLSEDEDEDSSQVQSKKPPII